MPICVIRAGFEPLWSRPNVFQRLRRSLRRAGICKKIVIGKIRKWLKPISLRRDQAFALPTLGPLRADPAF
jgi:hypothetical protein